MLIKGRWSMRRVRGIWEIAVPSSQFFCELKTAVKKWSLEKDNPIKEGKELE